MISNFVMGVNFTKLRPHPTGHFRLSHEYRTIKAVSLMNCMIQNRLDNNCKAVSYNERFRYCELNDKSGIYDVFDSTNTDGWKTYNVFNETAGEESGMLCFFRAKR